MAYVVLKFKDRQVGRWPMRRPMVIGRAPECDITVRDILLSRRHCRIENEGRDWFVTDLGSKNGTRIGGQAVLRHKLRDGDVIRIGKTAVRFCRGVMAPSHEAPQPNAGMRRPQDPFDAMAGTVADFQYEPAGPARDVERLPTPRPSPPEPQSYRGEKVHSLVSDLVSSSWDSIYEHAARPDRPLPRVGVTAVRPAVRPRPASADPALQLRPEEQPTSADDPTPKPRPKPLRSWRALIRRLTMIAGAGK